MPNSQNISKEGIHRRSGKFSILHLLLLTSVVGCLLALHQTSPHVSILLASMLAAWMATWGWVRWRQRPRPFLIRAATIVMLFSAWFCLYVASIGPASVLVRGMGERDGLVTIYAPVGWLHANTPLRKPLEAYTRWWD